MSDEENHEQMRHAADEEQRPQQGSPDIDVVSFYSPLVSPNPDFSPYAQMRPPMQPPMRPPTRPPTPPLQMPALLHFLPEGPALLARDLMLQILQQHHVRNPAAPVNDSIGDGDDPLLPENSPDANCICCRARKANVVFLNCGHMCACRNCVRSIIAMPNGLRCPKCRNPATGVQRVFE
jgi:hypothetical protein